MTSPYFRFIGQLNLFSFDANWLCALNDFQIIVRETMARFDHQKNNGNGKTMARADPQNLRSDHVWAILRDVVQPATFRTHFFSTLSVFDEK